MSVQEVVPYSEALGNGVSKQFPLGFPCDKKESLKVKINEIEVSTEHWSLNQNTVIFVTAPETNVLIQFERSTKAMRTTDYATYNDSLRGDVLNYDFDRIWWKLQELGLSDWLLRLRIDKEIKDRIAADIYHYTLVTKETNYKINELKEYLETLVNNLIGGDFLPILDKYIKTWSGRTQEQKNKENLSLYDFGYIADGTLHKISEKYTSLIDAQIKFPSAISLDDSIDTLATQEAINYCNKQGKATIVKIPAGTAIHNKEIIWKSFAHFHADSRHSTKWLKAQGFNERLIVSENFDALTGTSASLVGGYITDFSIKEIELNGNYMNQDQSAYINQYSGGNLYIYGNKYELDILSRNSGGVGVWLEFSGDESVSLDVRRYAGIKIESYTHAEECFIFKGPSDIFLQKVMTLQGGQITATDERNGTIWSSKTYSNLGRIDNCVFENGGEVGTIHSWGGRRGYGVNMNSGRLNVDLIISEANLGGINIGPSVYGQIDRIRTHNIKGGVTYTEKPHETAGQFANVNNNSISGLTITSITSEHNGSGQTGQNHVQINGAFNNIGNIQINGYGKSGHGIYINETAQNNIITSHTINNIVGTSGFDLASSAAIVRNSNNALRRNTIKNGNVTRTPIGLKTIGVNPRQETIEMMCSDVTKVFDGVTKSNAGQKWNITGFDTSNIPRNTEYTASLAFDSSITTHQELVFTHNLIQTPQIKDIQISLVDTPTGISGVTAIQYMYISDLNSEQIKVAVKLSIAHSINTTPYISVNAKV